MLAEIIILLSPGLLSVVIFKLLKREAVKGYSYVEYYAFFSFLIYFLGTSFMYMRKITDYSIRTLEQNEQIKYSIICFASAIVLPFIFLYGEKLLKSVVVHIKRDNN